MTNLEVLNIFSYVISSSTLLFFLCKTSCCLKRKLCKKRAPEYESLEDLEAGDVFY